MAYNIEQKDDQLRGSEASIRYFVSFPLASQHLISVRMEVDTEERELELVLPSWVPGSYKIRDFAGNLADVAATNQDGQKLDLHWIAKNRLQIGTSGSRTVHLTYVFYANERTVRTSHVNQFHAFINPGNCLFYVDGRTEEIHHVYIDHPWKRVSTALSPVSDNSWGSLNYDILVDSPLEIGDHFVSSFRAHGSLHEIAITGMVDEHGEWITDRIRQIVDTAFAMWGDLPYDRYLFILHFLPKEYGGLEHARSQVSMFDDGLMSDTGAITKFLALVTHELFHVWNVKRIRPVELGPFNYDTENYTEMLWLAEGATSYYDDLLTYRAGFRTQKEYLKELSESHLSALYNVPGRRSMSIKESSYLAWVKLYNPTADSHNRFPSYYLKGGVLFLLLDLYIISESGAEKSLDDVMLGLYRRYHERPERGVTEEEFFDIAEESTGLDVRSTFAQWLNGTDDPDLDQLLRPFGLTWSEVEESGSGTIGDIELPPNSPGSAGIQVSEQNGKFVVVKVWRDSAAERAGIGAGDEIIGINGRRIASIRDWRMETENRGDATTLKVLAAAEGTIYETELKPEKKVEYQLVQVAKPTPEQKRNLDRWLRRTDNGE